VKLSAKYRNSGDCWALVTGAAGGIGRAMAEKLATLGYNLVLVDIDGSGAHRRAADLHKRYGVLAYAMEFDLSHREAASALHDWCLREGIEPLIVVNNAGIFSYNDILATDPARIELFAGLHVLTVSMICRLFGSSMAARGRGYILNMSSYSTWMPWPGLALYSATKAYIRSFSLALAAEMREKGVSVTTVLPAGVTTGLYGLSPRLQGLGRRLGILLTPEHTAELALAAMFRGRRQYIPGYFMRLVLPLMRTLPAWAVRFVREKTIRFQK
jgi:short-subunit dehydrogenase